MTISPIIDALLKGAAAVGGLGALLYWTLQKTLEKTLDDRLAIRLEKTKHQLQLDLEKMSVVFQHQKDSFSKVLTALHSAIKTLEHSYAGSGDWLPISSEDVEKLRSALSEERLFLDSASDRALELYERIMWDAVNEPAIDIFAEGKDVRHAWVQMKFIADRLAQHFRCRVGLQPVASDPLQDVELLGACRVVTAYRFPGFNLPKESPLRLTEENNVAQVIAEAKGNPALLRAELQRLKSAIKTTERESRLFFNTIVEIDHYLEGLG